MNIVGKSKSIEYISQELPKLPIPKFEVVPGNKGNFKSSWQARKIANKIGYPVIVRSDGSEDKIGKSFAGIYSSQVVEEPWMLTNILRKIRQEYDSEIVAQYANSRCVTVPQGNIDVMIQKYSESKLRAIITRHPHRPGFFFVDLELKLSLDYSRRVGGVVTVKNMDTLISDYANEGYAANIDDIRVQLGKALKDYELIESLSGFDGQNISYQEEIGLFPYAVFQWRPFRRKQLADFDVRDLVNLNDINIQEMNTVFGITSQEGIEAMHFSCDGPTTYSIHNKSKEHFDRATKKFHASIAEFIEMDVPLATSFYEIGRYGDAVDKHFKKLPSLVIFNGLKNHGWQVHDSFRILERESLIALSDGSPFYHIDQTPVKYWSDGIRGFLKFEPIKTID